MTLERGLLDKYEKELLDSIENEEWISVYETSEQFESGKIELMKAARETLNISKEIEVSIRIPRNIFHKIKISAEKSGIHYQNWIINTLQEVVNH